MIDGMTRRFYDAVRPLILQRKVNKFNLFQYSHICVIVYAEYIFVAIV